MAEARVHHALITNEDEIRILISGLSRAGITATGNAILGYGAFKATSTSGEKITGVVDGREVSVIDNPARFDWFDAMQRRDETGLKLFREEAERCDRLAAPGPHVNLNVIQMGKYTPEEKRLVELIETVYGLPVSHYPNLMFLFTHGGDLDLQHPSVEDCRKAFPKLQQAISKYGGDVCWHVFNTEDPSQVTELMEKIHQLVMKNGGGYVTDEMIQKQDEMNEENKALQEEGERIVMELKSEDLEQTRQTLRKRFDEEARKQEHPQPRPGAPVAVPQPHMAPKPKPPLPSRPERLASLPRSAVPPPAPAADSAEMLAAMKQQFGGELREVKTQLQQLTVRLEDKERRDVELEKKRERREMQLENTIHTLQESQQVVLQEIKQLKGELEKSQKKWSVLHTLSNKVKQITDQLKDKESQLEKIHQQIEGAKDKLSSVRMEFVNSVSGATLNSLLDQLLHEGTIDDDEMESVKDVKPRADKARAIIDMVRRKGEEASSKMIEILKKDQNLCELL